MIAYKFLRAGRIGPFSAFAWPEPGVRVRAGAATDQCRRGIHACRTRDLPWWLEEELWEIELDGEPQIDEHKIVAPAGALRSQILGWTAACAQQYGEACAWRARDSAMEALKRAGRVLAANELGAVRDARRSAGDRTPPGGRRTGHSHQSHDRGRRRVSRAHRRACDERVYRSARRPATRRTDRLCRRTDLAVAIGSWSGSACAARREYARILLR